MIDGLTNSDVIVGAIGSAIVGVLSSLVPIFRKVADAMVGFMETKKATQHRWRFYQVRLRRQCREINGGGQT